MAASLRGFRPLFDRVLVQRLAPEVKTKSGLYIPEKAQGKVNEATVVAVGAGAKNKDVCVEVIARIFECLPGQNGDVIPNSVAVGDKILVPEYGGTKVIFDDQDYFMFRDGDVLGVYQ